MENMVAFCNNHWYCNGYVIIGDKESGYDIIAEDTGEVMRSYDDFESALVWVFNS